MLHRIIIEEQYNQNPRRRYRADTKFNTYKCLYFPVILDQGFHCGVLKLLEGHW